MNEGSKFISMHKKEEREEWRRSENGGVEIKNTMKKFQDRHIRRN